MNQFTPAQTKVIETWTEKRDSLLRDIGVYETQVAAVRKELTDAGQSLSDIHKQIEFAKGRLTEIEALEERMKNSLSTEVADLKVQKTQLEVEVAAKKQELESADKELVTVVDSVSEIKTTVEVMKDQSKTLTETVGAVISLSKTNLADSRDLMAEIRTVAAEVIQKGNENISQTGIILDKLPRYIFELQKPIPIRRAYAVPRGKVIEPEIKPE